MYSRSFYIQNAEVAPNGCLAFSREISQKPHDSGDC